MAVQHTPWKNYNTGQYFQVKRDQIVNLAIDFRNFLSVTDFINFADLRFTTTSSDLVITAQAVNNNYADGYTKRHIAQCIVQAEAVGTHPVKLKCTTNEGLTIVKHFDVRAVE